MEKVLITNSQELARARTMFNEVTNWDPGITKAIGDRKMPYLLIGCFAEDMEFGPIYQFAAVSKEDLNVILPVNN